jgi:hypothetical protein
MASFSRYSSKYKNVEPQASAQSASRTARFPTSVPIAIAQRKVYGKVEITCCIQSRACKWGKHESEHAAILSFLINASQPPDFKMHHFEIELCFSEQSSLAVGPSQSSLEPGLYLIALPSPSWVGGTPTMSHDTRQVNVQPQVEAAGVNASLFGYTRGRESDTGRSWILSSSWSPDPNDRAFKTAKWRWEANSDNPQIDDRGALYTAVALRHSAQPFQIVSTVNGKLISKNPLRKYMLSPRRDSEQPCFTKILPSTSDDDLKADIETLEAYMIGLNVRPAARVQQPSANIP